jgi:cytoskeleton protein RodZ
MPSLGEQLRAQRERKGITLEQAAADTRIREKFLTALEGGDYPALPGAVYTRGFLRNYAEYLDLETDDLVALFQQERGGAPPEPTPKRSFKPYRPVVHQSLIFRPVVFVPVLIIAFVGLFLDRWPRRKPQPHRARRHRSRCAGDGYAHSRPRLP